MPGDSFTVFVTTTGVDTPWSPFAHANYERVLQSARSSASNASLLADNPAAADCILFVEPVRRWQVDVLQSSMYRAYARKALVFDGLDNPFPVVPGIYVGLRQDGTQDGRFEGGYYPRVADQQRLLVGRERSRAPDLLFSFCGAARNDPKVRGDVMRLRHVRGMVRDRNANQSDHDETYAEILHRSQFVLCPRGLGPSSWRLFEAMRVGCVPVIISDDWAPPQGVDWASCSVRVPEASIAGIPALLEQLEPKAEAMGRAARETYERHFSRDGAFPWLVSRCRAILSRAAQEAPPTRWTAWRKAVAAGRGTACAREVIGARWGKR